MVLINLRQKVSKWLIVAAFLLPSFLGFLFFVFLPMLTSIVYSFTDYSGGLSFHWVGLQNYFFAFTSLDFYIALINTVKFTVVTVTLQILLGFGFAVLLNRQMILRGFFRSVIFLPVVLSLVTVSLAFMLILHPDKGPVNQFLMSMGFAKFPWLTSQSTALFTIMLVTLWQSFGYYMVVFLGGLQTIDPQLYEAAQIDGAGSWRQLRHITIPMLSPTTFFCIIMAIINSFKVFDSVFVMTGGQLGGGPAKSTTVLGFDIYQNAFATYRMGYASAESVILLLIVLTVTIIQYQGQNRWVTYN